MELLLAVVWYLALLMPGNAYSSNDVYNIAYDNYDAVQYVAENHIDDAVNHINTYDPEDGGIVLLPGTWDKEPIDHTDKSLWDPFGDLRKKKDSTSSEDTSNK
jgi:hypothetical protein